MKCCKRLLLLVVIGAVLLGPFSANSGIWGEDPIWQDIEAYDDELEVYGFDYAFVNSYSQSVGQFFYTETGTVNFATARGGDGTIIGQLANGNYIAISAAHIFYSGQYSQSIENFPWQHLYFTKSYQKIGATNDIGFADLYQTVGVLEDGQDLHGWDYIILEISDTSTTGEKDLEIIPPRPPSKIYNSLLVLFHHPNNMPHLYPDLYPDPWELFPPASGYAAIPKKISSGRYIERIDWVGEDATYSMDLAAPLDTEDGSSGSGYVEIRSGDGYFVGVHIGDCFEEEPNCSGLKSRFIPVDALETVSPIVQQLVADAGDPDGDGIWWQNDSYPNLPNTTAPINTITFHDSVESINYVVQDFPYWWPDTVTVQIQPTDGTFLTGEVRVNGNPNPQPLSGWHTDIEVSFDGDPILFEFDLGQERDIRLEWWGEGSGGSYPPLEPAYDPECTIPQYEGNTCVAIQTINTPTDVDMIDGYRIVRLSGFPTNWTPNNIVIGINSQNYSGTLPPGTVTTHARYGSTPYNISYPVYYYQIAVAYNGESNIDLSISVPIGDGYKIQWWAQ